MPTYREDLHLGHKVPTVETDDLTNRCVTEEKLADNSVSTRTIQDKAVTEPKLDDDAVSTRTIQDGAVTTPKIADKAVTPEKLSDRIVPEVIEPLLKPLRDKDTDLQNQIDSFNEHGLSVSNEFGDDPHIGVSQKTLTDTFNRIWSKIEDITGESLHGISMVVSPTYFIGEDGCGVHITANTAGATGVFEKIQFFINGELLTEAENVDYFEYDTQIEETSVVMCKAKILGIEYTEQKVVTHYSSFWLGAGSTYSDIMDVAHVIPITNGMRGAYNVHVEEDQKIIIVVGYSLREGFIRADLNGSEIQFTEQSVTVDGRQYMVFTSEPWSAGDYNIDING